MLIHKHQNSWFGPYGKRLLGAVWFFFLSLITPHSIFVTHYSLFKILQFFIPTPLAHFTQHIITQIFQLFVGLIPITWSEFCGSHTYNLVRVKMAYPQKISSPSFTLFPFHIPPAALLLSQSTNPKKWNKKKLLLLLTFFIINNN